LVPQTWDPVWQRVALASILIVSTSRAPADPRSTGVGDGITWWQRIRL
jgi:hypothetical protein